MLSERKMASSILFADSQKTNMPQEDAKQYIIDMLEQVMLLAQGSDLVHIANNLDQILEPYRQ